MVWAADLVPLVELLAPVEVLAVVLAESEAGISAFDANGRLVYLNERSARILERVGLVPSALLGRQIDAIEVGDDPLARAALAHWQERVALVRRSLARTDFQDEIELDGVRHLFVNTLIPRLDASGRLACIVSLARPSPILARAIDDPVAAMRLDERRVTLAMVAAGVAHEVSNPLTSIYANLEPVEAELERLRVEHPEVAERLEALAEPLAEAREGAERIRRVVEDIGLLARGDARGSPRIDLRDVVRSVLRLIGSDLERHTTISLTLEPPPLVAGSAARIGLMLMELLLHALGGLPAVLPALDPTVASGAASLTLHIAVGSDPSTGADAHLVITAPTHGRPIEGLRLSTAQDVAASLGGRVRITPREGFQSIVVTLPGVPGTDD